MHLPYATVREAVLFSAQMRFPRGVPRITMEAFTDEVSPACLQAIVDLHHRCRKQVSLLVRMCHLLAAPVGFALKKQALQLWSACR